MAQPFYNRRPLPNEGKLPEQELDYTKIIKIIISRWYWIVATLIIALLISYIYLWYTPRVYATNINIKYDEKKSEFSDLVTIINAGDRLATKIINEGYIIKSKEVIEGASKFLDWQISYYVKGKFRNTEIYPDKPFLVSIVSKENTPPNFPIIFKYEFKDEFMLIYGEGEKKIKKKHNYGKLININGFKFIIEKTSEPNPLSEYVFKFNSFENLYSRIRNGVSLTEVIKQGNIANLSMVDNNPTFAADVVNALAKAYINHDEIQKAKSSDQIIAFIDNQLNQLGKQVNSSAREIEKFKQSLKVGNIENFSENRQLLIERLEQDIFSMKINVITYTQVKYQMKNSNNKTSLNFNLFGNVDPLISNLINQYNQLIFKKLDALSIYNEKAQPIQEIDAQIDLLKNAISKNINSQIENLNTQIDSKNKKLAEYYTEMKSIPTAQKNMDVLDRDFGINQKIYSFLSEKRLEAQITKASILSSASIIEPARPNFNPISPDKTKIYRSAWILGIFSGIGLIFLMRSINPYIYDKETVESITNVPIIGVIRKFTDKIETDNSQILTLRKPKSIFAESVRSVRTNLSFLANEKGSKVVCITSEISGEGKSFVTLNLASTLALIDKKVILLAGDLRRSKLFKSFNVSNTKGLSTYLSNQEKSLQDVIQHSQQENLDFIISGPVPPNPSELLYSSNFTNMLEELKKIYDYILIDTAPVGLVSDAIPIIRQSDINLFIIRAGVSKYNAATIPQRIEQEYSLNNTVIVLNAFIEDALHSRYYSTKYTGNYNGYYYSDYSGYTGYGYYSDDERNKWWKFWKYFKKTT